MKKIRLQKGGYEFSSLNKLLLMAKLTTLLILISFMQLSAKVYAQAGKLDLKVKNVSIFQVFEEIEDNSEYRFFYDNDQVDLSKKVSINTKQEEMSTILKELFKGTDLTYLVKDRLILVQSGNSNERIIISSQQNSISGTVTDESGQPLPGVTIIVIGTTQGTVTNNDGWYILGDIPEDATLQFSFVGMLSQEAKVGTKTEINVTMAVDAIGIEEVVAIGYGSVQAQDLTAPIPTINSDEIIKNINTSAVSALQGSVAGIQVINDGKPGGVPSIRVRGIGSMHGASPLYVVDGMFYNEINWLSPNDIKSISLLKDASAASIYGVRASGGVIIVTTKQGQRNEKITIEYDGYAGIKQATQMLEMTNSEQYSTLLIESGLAGKLDLSMELFGKADKQISYNGVNYDFPATNTMYYDELLETGKVMNHSLSVRGGGEKAAYYVGTSYFEEDGLLKGDQKYSRINLKSSLNFNPYNFIKIGANIVINQNKSNIINPTQIGNPSKTSDINPSDIVDGSEVIWKALYNALPILPMYESNGELAGIAQAGFATENVKNPAIMLKYEHGYGGYTKTLKLNYSAFADINLLKDDKLVWRTQFSHEIISGNQRRYLPSYFVDYKQNNAVSTLRRDFLEGSNIQIDHTLTYKEQFNLHSVTAMGGFSSRKVDRLNAAMWANDVPWGENGREEFLYIKNGEADSSRGDDGGSASRGVSYFGRLMYNYNKKYLFNATFRADGTDKYKQTWGYFPSFGAGWVMSEEPFMQNQSFFDYAKLRASWGQLGNNAVPRESGSLSVTRGFDSSYVFDDILAPAYTTSTFYNELRWEILEEFNIGTDLAFFDNRLDLEVDWFRKVTKRAAIRTSNIMGAGNLLRNLGEILNTGFEVVAGWKSKIGELGYNVNANISTLKNEVLSLGSEPYISNGDGSFTIRSEVGHPLYSYYGYKAIGIYQNQQEIESHLDTETHPQVEPGFLKYEDIDDNGIIDDKDRQYLGANIPKITYGGSVNLDYKSWDFGVSFYGISGNKIVNRNRGDRKWNIHMNFDAAQFKNRWTGEGSTNKYPSATGLINTWNLDPINSYLVESGSYFKIQNVTLGYTIKNLIPGNQKGPALRIKVVAQNPISFFKYNGFDPNVGGQGLDRGVYPLSSSYVIGVNLTY